MRTSLVSIDWPAGRLARRWAGPAVHSPAHGGKIGARPGPAGAGRTRIPANCAGDRAVHQAGVDSRRAGQSPGGQKPAKHGPHQWRPRSRCRRTVVRALAKQPVRLLCLSGPAGRARSGTVAIETIGADQVWNLDRVFKGTGVRVAVLDTGVVNQAADWHRFGSNKPRLRGCCIQGLRAGSGYSAYDDNGHGTHVAGIVVGSGNKSQGASFGRGAGCQSRRGEGAGPERRRQR